MKLLALLAATSTALAAPHFFPAPQPTSKPAEIQTAPAPKRKTEDLSSLLEPIIAKHDVPGMVAGIVVGDRLVAAGRAGVRKRGTTDKIKIGDQFHIGSCTKAMTATLCAILVEKGTLRWDMTLAEAFPKLAPKMHEAFKSVTLEQLLTNRAGVPSNLDGGGLWGKLWLAKGGPVAARKLLFESIVTQEPLYPPGTRDVYSNAGFAIAGHMAETLAGKPYETLMQEHLFAPLGMTRCGWGAPGKPGKVLQPWGHNKAGEPQNPLPNTPDGKGADNPPAITPAGRLHCTLGDWSKFVSLHLRGDANNPQRDCKLVSGASFDKLHTPPDALSDYAFGWGRPVRPWARGEGEGATGHVLTHSGSNTIWFAVTWVAPERDFAVLVMCNQAERGSKACDEAAWALIQHHLKAADR